MSEPWLDRLKASFAVLVRTLTAHHDYGALYAATVKNQSADLLTVGVVFDDARFAPADGIPLRLGLPGVKVKVEQGARVLIGFENQDPAKARATLWDTPHLLELRVDPSTATVFNGGSANVGRVGDSVAPTSAFATWLGSVATATSVPLPPGAGFGTISSGTAKVKA